MRRLKLSAAALTAVIAVAVVAPSGAGAQNLPVHVFDTFNGTSLNPAKWYLGTPNPGTTVSVHDGSLWLGASSNATSGFNIGPLLDCQVVGDFDAQIAFTLSTWPADSNVTLALSAPPLGQTFLISTSTGDDWGLFAPIGTGYGFTTFPVSAPVQSGSLRLIRQGAETSGYYRTGPSPTWHRIGTLTASTAPAYVGAAIWNVGTPFGGQPVSVAIHSFNLQAAGTIGYNGLPCTF